MTQKLDSIDAIGAIQDKLAGLGAIARIRDLDENAPDGLYLLFKSLSDELEAIADQIQQL